jgi:hypothetical protein
MKSACSFKMYFVLGKLINAIVSVEADSFKDMTIRECVWGGEEVIEALGENVSQCPTVHHKSHMT